MLIIVNSKLLFFRSIFFSLMIMFFLYGTAYAEKIVTKESCISIFGMNLSTSADVKEYLKTTTKREVAEELFGTMIKSFTELKRSHTMKDNFETFSTNFKDNVKSLTIGFIRIDGIPEYYNGKGFGEVCIKMNAYAKDEDFEKYNPKTLKKKSCEMEGDVKNIKGRAEKKAIAEILFNYDQSLKNYNFEEILPLLHEVKYSEEGFISGTPVYCVKAIGKIYPIEIESTKLQLNKPPSLLKSEKGKTETKTYVIKEQSLNKNKFVLDLVSYEIGDLVETLGTDLLVGVQKGEKYLKGFTDNGRLEIKNLALKNKFEVSFSADWNDFTQTILLESDESDQIKITFKESYVSFGNTKTQFNKGTGWKGGTSVNDCRIYVKDKIAKFFINDQYFATAIINPFVYTKLIIRGIKRSDLLFNVKGSNL